MIRDQASLMHVGMAVLRAVVGVVVVVLHVPMVVHVVRMSVRDIAMGVGVRMNFAVLMLLGHQALAFLVRGCDAPSITCTSVSARW